MILGVPLEHKWTKLPEWHSCKLKSTDFRAWRFVLAKGTHFWSESRILSNRCYIPTKSGRNQTWGFRYEHFAEICGSGTGMLWKRMFEQDKKAWRRVYKVWQFQLEKSNSLFSHYCCLIIWSKMALSELYRQRAITCTICAPWNILLMSTTRLVLLKWNGYV